MLDDVPEPTPPIERAGRAQGQHRGPGADRSTSGSVNSAHTWEVVERPPTDQVRGMRVDTLPPHTAITLAAGW